MNSVEEIEYHQEDQPSLYSPLDDTIESDTNNDILKGLESI